MYRVKAQAASNLFGGPAPRKVLGDARCKAGIADYLATAFPASRRLAMGYAPQIASEIRIIIVEIIAVLVTQWFDHDNRETRDIDFLGFGSDEPEAVRSIFAEIMQVKSEDGLVFDTDAITASPIREAMEYGGIRLRTAAYLEKTRVPVVLDIGFGDALADPGQTIDYPSILGMDRPNIRSYPPASVIAEKFQAVVALGLANGRMKDFYDLWALPRALEIEAAALDAAIAATFERRGTPVPTAQQRWRVYVESLDLPAADFQSVLDEIWEMLGTSCGRLNGER